MKNFQLLKLAFLLLMLSFLMTSAHAQSFEQRALEEALNPDGTLKAGINGSFKTDGYQMRTGPNGEPIFVPQTQSTTGSWDTQFAPPIPDVSGTVYALATDANGNVYVGGAFTQAGTVSANRVARYNFQEKSWYPLGSGVSDTVYALATDANGNVYVGGKFTQAGGQNNVFRVARFNSLTNTWNALGSGFSNGVSGTTSPQVFAIVVDANGNVFVGGHFWSAGSIGANNVARYDLNGNTWSALGSPTNGVNNTVRALAVDGSGNLFVGGEFTNAGGVGASRVARFNGTSWSPLGSPDGTNNTVRALAVDGSGNLFVGGDFTQAGGIGVSRLARFNGTSWSSQSVSNTPLGANNTVRALAIDGGGNLYVGGDFTQVGIGVNASRVAQLSATAWSALGSPTNNGVNNTVHALAVVGSNDLFVGGNFTQAGTISLNRVARFNVPTNNWSVLNTTISNGINGPVYAFATDGSGNLYVGGNFTQVGSISANSVAKYNIQTGSWSRLGTQTNNGVSGASATVFALAFRNGLLCVGGSFTQAGGANVGNVAFYIPQSNSWAPLGIGASIGVHGQVTSLAFSGDTVYVGGYFGTAGIPGPSAITANRVARFINSTGTWSSLGTGSNNGVNLQVLALAVYGNNLYVGGAFTQAGGASANYVARFNLQTNTWSALGSGVNNSINTLAIDGNGRVYAGGTFTQAGGANAFYVARFDPSGSGTWSRLGQTASNNGVNNVVKALAIDGQGRVYVGGMFNQANVIPTVSANRVALYDPQTNTWSALGAAGNNGVSGGSSPTVNALTVDGSGRVYVGGEFTQAGTVLSNNIARFFQPSSMPSLGQTVSTSGLFAFPPTGVSVNFTGVSGTGTCTVERYDTPASNISFTGTPPTFTSQYRFVITATGFSFTNAELRFNRTQIPNAGITDASTVRVYRRPTPGTGAFSILPNAFNASAPDEVRATTTAFSEFILASDDNQLPVELTEFGFRKVDSGIELHWRTATELNNSGFEVERKSQGADWNTLGFVRGRGTTTEAQSYSFLDRTATGKVQYRLKQIDFDGQFEYSNVIEVDAGAPKQFALEQNYPNPFNPTTTISYQLPVASQVSLKVFDVLGREVMTLVNGRQDAGVYNLSLNAATLSSGIYFYRLQSGNFVQTKKMMLVK